MTAGVVDVVGSQPLPHLRVLGREEACDHQERIPVTTHVFRPPVRSRAATAESAIPS